eukprot:3401474-Prymnesium_polylepis.1
MQSRNQAISQSSNLAHLADRLHRRAEAGRDVLELIKVPPRELDDDVVERGLEARGGGARDRVAHYGEGLAERELGGDIGER